MNQSGFGTNRVSGSAKKLRTGRGEPETHWGGFGAIRGGFRLDRGGFRANREQIGVDSGWIGVESG